MDVVWWMTPLVTAVVCLVPVAAYRLYLHPLANIPGPRLAALTYLYRTYYNATNGSRYYAQIEKLHAQYGRLQRPRCLARADQDKGPSCVSVRTRST